MEVKALGFDLDGTLYKQDDGVNRAIRDYACEKASEILGKDYTLLREEFEVLYNQQQSGRVAFGMLGIKDGKALMQEAIENVDMSKVLKQDSRLVGVLNKLGESRNLFLVTSSSQKSALSKLGALGISPLAFDIALYGRSGFIREDGTAFEYASNKFGVPYREMMFVGDRESVDILPAKGLGIWTAMVNGFSEKADFNLKDIYQIGEILEV